jgi:predicted DNA-binding transcriptional regulator YafY
MTVTNESDTHKRIRLAIVRIEQGRPNIIDKSRKISVSAVAEEAGVSRTTITRDHPDLDARIKGGQDKTVRQARDAKHEALKKEQARNKELRDEVAHLRELLTNVQSQNATLLTINHDLSRKVGSQPSNVTQFPRETYNRI